MRKLTSSPKQFNEFAQLVNRNIPVFLRIWINFDPCLWAKNKCVCGVGISNIDSLAAEDGPFGRLRQDETRKWGVKKKRKVRIFFDF